MQWPCYYSRTQNASRCDNSDGGILSKLRYVLLKHHPLLTPKQENEARSDYVFEAGPAVEPNFSSHRDFKLCCSRSSKDFGIS